MDANELPMTRSMARLQAHQKMLLLRRLQDFPVLERAVPVFEWVLSQKDLGMTSQSIEGAGSSMGVPFQTAQSDETDSWFGELLGFNLLENIDLST